MTPYTLAVMLFRFAAVAIAIHMLYSLSLQLSIDPYWNKRHGVASFVIAQTLTSIAVYLWAPLFGRIVARP
jgi:heme/copper-type cytochrome/quinol oxidase subunit 4